MEQTFKLSGFTCGSCAILAERYIKKIEGVDEVKVDLGGKVAIFADRKINQVEVQHALKDTNYSVLM